MNLSTELGARIDVPENAFAGDQPLVAVERGGYVGSLHRGTMVVADTSGEMVISIGDAQQPVFLRSAAKPFQVMPAVLGGALERYGVTDRELAVLCASHSGEPRHMEAVLSVLTKIGLDETALRCGVHPPQHEETARRRWEAEIEPTPVCNNCSGAHAGMLLACRAMGWPIETYGDPDHPLQRMTRETIGAFAGVSVNAVQMATDNCAVPTFRLPIRQAALVFARLGAAEGVTEQLAGVARRVVRAMTSYPEMVGGEERFDSDLMRVAGGSIVAKGGAEGFEGIGLPARKLGMAMKVSDGNSRAIGPAVMQVLAQLGGLTGGQIDELESYGEPRLYNLQGELVGRLVPVFHLGGSA